MRSTPNKIAIMRGPVRSVSSKKDLSMPRVSLRICSTRFVTAFGSTPSSIQFWSRNLTFQQRRLVEVLLHHGPGDALLLCRRHLLSELKRILGVLARVRELAVALLGRGLVGALVLVALII